MKYSEALRKDPEGFKRINTRYPSDLQLLQWERSHEVSNAHNRVQYKGCIEAIWVVVANAKWCDNLSPEEIAKQLEACGE